MAGKEGAFMTGGSRGIGAATATALAEDGYDVAFTYRNKSARAEAVVRSVEALGRDCIALEADITRAEDVTRIASALWDWGREIAVLVLNASGGLERDLVSADPDYPWRINRDAQIAVLDAVLPFMPHDGTVVFVTSHWAHLYGRVDQLPSYATVAETKYAGEQALRGRQGDLAERGVRLIVVTGDLVQGTITPKLLERAGPGMTSQREAAIGALPTAEEMGRAIAAAARDRSLPSGHTVVVGGALESLPRSETGSSRDTNARHAGD
jgi:NAD(P)-dependent dehydrogenase (short-subunit alcohol dehydrogenase family)